MTWVLWVHWCYVDKSSLDDVEQEDDMGQCITYIEYRVGSLTLGGHVRLVYDNLMNG